MGRLKGDGGEDEDNCSKSTAGSFGEREAEGPGETLPSLLGLRSALRSGFFSVAGKICSPDVGEAGTLARLNAADVIVVVGEEGADLDTGRGGGG